MGKSYFVPRKVKGESRILYIFSMKSFITTAIFGSIGGYDLVCLWYLFWNEYIHWTSYYSYFWRSWLFF